MFGYVVMNRPEIKFKDYDLYRSFYCGLCRELRERYGISGQITLTYDMTFVILLLSGLYEPPTKKGTSRCMVHPVRKQPVRKNKVTEYAADMNVFLAYYKCVDDWKDEKKLSRLAYSRLLKNKDKKAEALWKKKTADIIKHLNEISAMEKAGETDIDKISGCFGKIMEEILAWREDEWEPALRRMGFYLGKFIYLMDAYDDVEKDSKDGSYNPFKELYKQEGFEEKVRQYLELIMSYCCRAFEVLPIIDNAEIMRNILYAGVWAKYTRVTQERKKPETTGEGENKAAEKAAE